MSEARPNGKDGGVPADLWGDQREFYTFSPESLGQSLPQFEIRGEVGKGSMGIVYDAIVRATGQRIALKILPPSLTLTERALARFLREGRVMARVQHPDIVAFHDQGHAGRLHWFAMEFVDGITLQERLKVGPLPIRRAVEIAARVGRALHFAHDCGVVHRDVKPGNVMLRRQPPDGIAITDFGLARETGTGSMTDSGAIVGTPMYMAPELVLGGSAQASTLADVYSLGATLYHLLTGQPPFDAPTAQGVLKLVLEHEPTAPQRLRRELPAALCASLATAMARDGRHRYGSALEFAEDLERFLRGERVLARQPGPVERLMRFVRRRPQTVALAGLALLTTYAGLAWRDERRRSEIERQLGEAERLVALAATNRDDQDRQRSTDERRELLLAAVAAAARAIGDDDSGRARLVRAKAHQRLRLFEEAIADLDAAELRIGGPTTELLHLRIEALRQLGDPDALARLHQDLTRLLRLDPGTHTRALVAEHLLDLAEPLTGHERDALVQAASDVLAAAELEDPRVAVLQARVLELDGDVDGALAALDAARERHRGDLYVHLQAAAMFRRQGLLGESAREAQTAQLLQPGAAAASPLPTAVDLDGVGRFLGDVDRLMQALDPVRTGKE